VIEVIIGVTVVVVGLMVVSRTEGDARTPKRGGELDRPRVRADAAQDHAEVKVVATLADRAETTSPVGDRRCLSWRLEIERFEHGTWRSVLDRTFVGALEATDESVTVSLREESEVVVSWPEAPAWTQSRPEAVVTMLTEAGVPDAFGPLRWRETLFRAGDRIAILGTARWRVDASDYREAARTLEIGNRGRLPLLLSARAEHLR
jgi:hypothetical protein